MSAGRMTLVLAAGVLAAAGLAPLVAVLAESLTVDGRLSLAAYRLIFRSADSWHLLGNSVLLATSVAVVATLTGLPLGVLLGKTDLPFRRVLAVLFTVPFLLPPYVVAVAWFHVLGRGGLVARWLGPAAAEGTHALLFGLPGVVLVLVSGLMPIVLLLTMAFIRTVPPRLEEAARLAGRWPWVFRRITIPLIAPGALLGALLVFILALGEFTVPMFLRYDVYSSESFTRFAAFYQPDAATAAAVPLALVVLVVLAAERHTLRDRTYEMRFAASSSEVLTVPLARGRGTALGLVLAAAVVVVGLPLLSLAVRSAEPAAYSDALSRGWDALLRSIGYAAAGATLLTLVGFFVGYLVQRRALPAWRTVDSLTILLFALPSTVMGIGLITLWNRPATAAIYGTAWLVLVGYVAQYTAVTSRATVAGLSAIPGSMEEAARMAGAGWFRRVSFIVAPLAGRTLGVAWLIAYLLCLRDTGLTMMIYPPGGDTLPVRTFTLMANGAPELIAALCMIMVLATLLPFAVLGLFSRRIRPRAERVVAVP